MQTDSTYLSTDVHVASGMVAAQLDCRPDEALTRMRMVARATAQTMEQVADDILARVIRFDE